MERGIFRNGSARQDIAIPPTIWAIMLRNSSSANADYRILAAGMTSCKKETNGGATEDYQSYPDKQHRIRSSPC